jgi:hypothetical protein
VWAQWIGINDLIHKTHLALKTTLLFLHCALIPPSAPHYITLPPHL